jgi:hypothetical protein
MPLKRAARLSDHPVIRGGDKQAEPAFEPDNLELHFRGKAGGATSS